MAPSSDLSGKSGTLGETENPGDTFEFVSVDGKLLRVLNLTVSAFCNKYEISLEIAESLHNADFRTAGALLEVSDTDLMAIKLKKGHIAELKRALKEFIYTGGA
ncbi:hypothetical protein B0H16DRAFT_1897914 [Mycena metata]|uniref:Uncharacterized protein n=1 Tax=Mycena metata TaxID=1033252 RepID=A0AAD7MHC8_9AGAR|nr:hypothetical protein B0H16DRAFT_1897914 [Mycena metata]